MRLSGQILADLGRHPSLIAHFARNIADYGKIAGIEGVFENTEAGRKADRCAILRLRASGLPCGYATAAASARRNPSDYALRPETETAFGRH